jgi:hypothetical protein
VCSDTEKNDLCKIFLSFSVFQCGAFGRSILTSGRHSLEVRTGMEPTCPDRPDGVRTRAVIIVRTRATSLLLFEAASVRTSSIHRPDGDPTEAINSHARRILTLPHKISLLVGCEFPFCEFLAFCIFLVFQVLCFSPYLFSFFF